MAEKMKIPHAEACALAKAIGEQLRPHVERLRIVGSVRRLKALVGDVEFLYVPKVERVPVGLFADDVKTVNLAERFFSGALASGFLAKRPNKNGIFTWGEQNKLGRHVASGLPVDFFATTEANWWVSLVIRTGSKDTNLKLTTGAQKMGRTLNAYGCGVTESDGTVIAATSEEQVFELCGVPYVEPRLR